MGWAPASPTRWRWQQWNQLSWNGTLACLSPCIWKIHVGRPEEETLSELSWRHMPSGGVEGTLTQKVPSLQCEGTQSWDCPPWEIKFSQLGSYLASHTGCTLGKDLIGNTSWTRRKTARASQGMGLHLPGTVPWEGTPCLSRLDFLAWSVPSLLPHRSTQPSTKFLSTVLHGLALEGDDNRKAHSTLQKHSSGGGRA